MKVYLVQLCAWHRKYFNQDKCIGIIEEEKPKSYKGEVYRISHGICDDCHKRLKEEEKEKWGKS